MTLYNFLKEEFKDKKVDQCVLKNKIEKYYSDSNYNDKEALNYLILLNLVERVYLRSFDFKELPDFEDFLWENRHNELFKEILEIEEENLDDENYVSDIINENELNNFNTFDEIFLFVYKNYDKLSLEKRMELMEKYFSDWIDWY